MVEIGLIGAGRVGRTLTALLPRDEFRLGPVLGRSFTSARRAVREMENGTPAANVEELSPCRVILIAVPDTAMQEIVERLEKAAISLKKKVVIQTSRLHSSLEMDSLRRRGAAVGSLQPLYVLQRPVLSLAGVCCAVEGDPAATRMARRMVRSWDGEFQLVRAQQKLHLGIASSIAADFLPGLLEMAVQQLTLAGFLKKRSLSAIFPLLHAAAREYERAGRRARPGPLLANRPGTVRCYLERLEAVNPAAADAYRRTARQTLEVMRRMSDEFSFLDHPDGAGNRALGATAGAGSK